MSEKKFGRIKGQTKAQSIISDPLLFPYEIQVDEYSYTVIDSSKNGNNFGGSFTELRSAVNKIIQYQLAAERDTFGLDLFIKRYESIKSEIYEKLEL